MRAIPGHYDFACEEAAGPNNPTTPDSFLSGFGLDYSHFARRYYGNPFLVSLPPPTWMLPFGGFLLPRWECHRYYPWREAPFGNLRIEGCVRLPGAYRSLPRPSSAPKPSHPSGSVSCHALRNPRLICVKLSLKRPLHSVTVKPALLAGATTHLHSQDWICLRVAPVNRYKGP